MQSSDDPSDLEHEPTPSSSHDTTVYECRDCENVAVAVDDAESLRCHGAPMRPAADTALAVADPAVRDVLGEVFEVPKAGLEICECVVGSGPVSTAEIADRLDYDRTTVTDYLDRLVAAGFLERTRLNCESGGFVNVYYSRDADELSRDLRVALYCWASRVGRELEDSPLVGAESEGNQDPTPTDEIFWHGHNDS